MMKTIAVILVTLTFSGSGFAQKKYDANTTKLVQEFMKIQSSFDASGDDEGKIKTRSIDMYMEDMGEEVAFDTIHMTYSTQAGKFVLTTGPSDSIKVIQNDTYQVAVYKYDRIVAIQKPVAEAKGMLQGGMTDSLLQNLAIQSITAKDSSNTYRRLSVVFEDSSPYVSYDVMYNKDSYEVSWLKYSIKKEGADMAGKKMNMVMVFNKPTYSTSSDFFSIDDYVKVIDVNNIRTSVNTANFEVINLINE